MDPTDAEAADDDDAESSLDDVLRALAAAPRPNALGLAARALPEGLASTLSSGTGAQSPTPQPGELIDGRYRIEAILGAGGMGVVFAAIHVQTGRKVALKWMRTLAAYRSAAEHEAAWQRFVREAQAAGRIHHPNVVDVYDASADPRTPYLSMERLEGETLRARMDRGRVPWDEALALLLPAMRGVAEAHRKGVVHRDLKPDNVFLARANEGAEVCPKVLDFGVSRLHGGDVSAGEPSLTRTGTIIGTPAYMPLEQLRGEGDIGERTDVYALGVVLYEMLAGERPYVARNAADYAALLLSEAPTPLSKYCPELRGGRERVVMRALGRRADERYASVQAFIDDLNAPPRALPSGRALLLACIALGLLALALVFVLARDSAPALNADGPAVIAPEPARTDEPSQRALIPADPVPSAPLDPARQPAAHSLSSTPAAPDTAGSVSAAESPSSATRSLDSGGAATGGESGSSTTRSLEPARRAAAPLPYPARAVRRAAAGPPPAGLVLPAAALPASPTALRSQDFVAQDQAPPSASPPSPKPQAPPLDLQLKEF